MENRKTIMKIPITACVLLLLLTAPSRAQNAEPFRTDINPALLYYQAFIVEPHLEQSEWDYLETNEWKAPNLDEHFGKLLAEFDDTFRLVRQAAYSKVPCDWGVDRTSGASTLLPELAYAKGVALNANRRVKWDLQHGRQDDAREDLLAALALGRNISRDGTIISVLVQASMESIVSASVAENFGRFSPEQLQKIADGMDATPARGTVSNAIISDVSVSRNSLLSRVEELQRANPGDDGKVMEDVRKLIMDEQGDTNFWPKLEKAAGGTSEGIVRLLHEREQFTERMAQELTAVPGESFPAKAAELEAEFTNSPNPFVAGEVTVFLKTRARDLWSLTALAEVRAAVKFKLQGEAGLNSVPDPSGNGPFKIERFFFEGVDRGFKLTPAYNMRGSSKPVVIFVEKEGPPFTVIGNHAGTPRYPGSAEK